MANNDIKEALKVGFPLFIGYVPPAIAFGILAKSCEISLLESFMFSAVVFAGASQFIALNLLMTGMGPGGIILTTLLVNFRHFLMSTYLSTRIGKMAKRYIFLLAFGVTDEVFSVLSFTKRKLTKTFVFILQLSAYTGWVSGTVAGYIMGGFLPEILTKSMGVALYALLLAILLPELKTSAKAICLTIASGALNTILIKLDMLPDGWNIIACILVIAFIGSFFMFQEQGEKAYG
ncbi:MAG: AzlC family ABC transporter permease [Desulfobacteraceae bacterium]|nr:AzlC family ABC transporter permease [Desulfobacteraceae bacterium]